MWKKIFSCNFFNFWYSDEHLLLSIPLKIYFQYKNYFFNLIHQNFLIKGRDYKILPEQRKFIIKMPFDGYSIKFLDDYLTPILYTKEEFRKVLRILKDKWKKKEEMELKYILSSSVDDIYIEKDYLKYNLNNVELFNFQKVVVYYGMKYKKFLNADKTGTGKTISTIALLSSIPNYYNLEKLRVLVLCIKVMKYKWLEYINRYINYPKFISVILRGKNPEYMYPIIKSLKDKKFVSYIINYEILKDWETYIKRDFMKPNIIIIDEIHHIKNIKAKRTNSLISIVETVKPEYIFALSGTPYSKSVEDLYTIFRILGIKCIISRGYNKGYTFFLNRYTEIVNEKFKIRKGKNLKELNLLMRKTFLIRRDYKDLEKELSKKFQIINEKIEVEVDLERYTQYEEFLYKEIKKELLKKYRDLTYLDENTLKKVINRFGYIPKLLRFLSDLKKESIREFLENLLEKIENEKFVVVLFHNELFEYLMRYFNDIALGIWGKTKESEIPKINKEFLNNEKKRLIFIKFGSSGSEGLDLQVSRRLIFAELRWDLINIEQAMGRIKRVVQEHSLLYYYYIIAKETIEEIMMRVLQARFKENKQIFDSDIKGEIVKYMYNKIKGGE